jgi:hypothetical protein
MTRVTDINVMKNVALCRFKEYVIFLSFFFSILNEFVQKTPSMVDKKKREIQEIAQKLLEAVSNIAGSSLEQTTWLRKNYAVKPGPQSDEPEDGNQNDDGRYQNWVIRNSFVVFYIFVITILKKVCTERFVDEIMREK